MSLIIKDNYQADMHDEMKPIGKLLGLSASEKGHKGAEFIAEMF